MTDNNDRRRQHATHFDGGNLLPNDAVGSVHLSILCVGTLWYLSMITGWERLGT